MDPVTLLSIVQTLRSASAEKGWLCMFGFKNTLTLIGVAVTGFAVGGWYLGWYTISSSEDIQGQSHLSINLNPEKLEQDLSKGELQVKEFIANKPLHEIPVPPPKGSVPGQIYPTPQSPNMTLTIPASPNFPSYPTNPQLPVSQERFRPQMPQYETPPMPQAPQSPQLPQNTQWNFQLPEIQLPAQNQQNQNMPPAPQWPSQAPQTVPQWTPPQQPQTPQPNYPMPPQSPPSNWFPGKG